MRNLLASVVLGAALLTSGAAIAAPGMAAGWQAGMIESLDLTPAQQEKFRTLMRERTQKRLGLSDDQVAEFEKIRTEGHNRREELFKKYGLDEKQFKAMRKKLREIRQETRGKIDALLTEEQKSSMRSRKKGRAGYCHERCSDQED
ncbi:MAG: Spy/CpxP family protein refolding chaperone [Endozoicomonas sp.]